MEPFDPELWLHSWVDRRARVTLRHCHYSAPATLIGRPVRVSLQASAVVT